MRSKWIMLAIIVFGGALLAATAIADTTPANNAWGERLQAEARVYQQLQQRDKGPTALGLKAWGKRLQAEAGVYQQVQQQQDEGPTALGLEAWGKRLQAETRVYQQLRSETARSSANGFDWGDAGIGGLIGFTLAAGCIGVALVRRRFAWGLGRPRPA